MHNLWTWAIEVSFQHISDTASRIKGSPTQLAYGMRSFPVKPIATLTVNAFFLQETPKVGVLDSTNGGDRDIISVYFR